MAAKIRATMATNGSQNKIAKVTSTEAASPTPRSVF